MQPMPATQTKMLCAMQITTTFYNPVATNYIYMLPAMMIPLQQAINWEGNKQMQLTLTQMTMILTQVKKTCPSGRYVVRPSICCNQLIVKLCLLFLQPTPKVNQSSWTFKMNLSTTQSSPQCSRKPTTMKIWNNVPSRMQPSTKSSRTWTTVEYGSRSRDWPLTRPLVHYTEMGVQDQEGWHLLSQTYCLWIQPDYQHQLHGKLCTSHKQCVTWHILLVAMILWNLDAIIVDVKQLSCMVIWRRRFTWTCWMAWKGWMTNACSYSRPSMV